MVTYTGTSADDIAFVWVVLLSFVNGKGFNNKINFKKALGFIQAVYKPENIVGDVHGHTEVLKPEPVVPAAGAASSSEGSSSSSEEEDADEDSSPNSSSSADEAPKEGARKKQRREATV